MCTRQEAHDTRMGGGKKGGKIGVPSLIQGILIARSAWDTVGHSLVLNQQESG